MDSNHVQEKAQIYESKLNLFFSEEISLGEGNMDSGKKQDLMQLRLHLIALSSMQIDTFEEPLPKPSGIKARIVWFFKKIIRKMTRFLLAPYALKMYRYQQEVSDILGKIVKQLEVQD